VLAKPEPWRMLARISGGHVGCGSEENWENFGL
jgi:hypothetical protein